MITALDILKAGQALGVTLDVTTIKSALATIDQTTLQNSNRNRYQVKIWDKVSDINGIPSSQILERYDISPDGEVYLIYVDGKLQIFQPHAPNQQGHVAMDRATAERYASDHAEEISTSEVDKKIIDQVLNTLIG